MMMETAGNDFSDSVLQVCVRKCYHEIVTSFDPTGPILNKVFAQNIISLDDMTAIESKLPNERCKALVNMLLSSKEPGIIASFLAILANEPEREWIATMIYEEAETKVASSRIEITCGKKQKRQRKYEQTRKTQRKRYKCDARKFGKYTISKPPPIAMHMSNDEIKQQIRRNYTLIDINVDPRYDILSKLFEKEILTSRKLKYLRKFWNDPRICCQK